jgi:hypothetical protein
MTDNMRVLLVGTALTVTIAVLGSWGGMGDLDSYGCRQTDRGYVWKA